MEVRAIPLADSDVPANMNARRYATVNTGDTVPFTIRDSHGESLTIPASEFALLSTNDDDDGPITGALPVRETPDGRVTAHPYARYAFKDDDGNISPATNIYCTTDEDFEHVLNLMGLTLVKS